MEFTDKQVIIELEKRNAKTFGGIKRCRERLQRFIDHEKKCACVSNPMEENKVVHIEITDLEEVTMDIDEGIDHVVNLYRELLLESMTQSDIFYGNKESRKELRSYKRWKQAQDIFLENGLRSYLDNEE